MSAPRLARGCDAAPLFIFLLRRLDFGRGFRAPLAQIIPDGDTRTEMYSTLAGMLRASRQELAGAALELRAIESYYWEIGARFDAARVRDVQQIVTLALDRACRSAQVTQNSAQQSAHMEN
jgi:hypothetical protein